MGTYHRSRSDMVVAVRASEDWKQEWNDVHLKTYQYLFYFSTNTFILCPDFVTSG